MAKIPYITKKFDEASSIAIHYARQICAQFAEEGYDLTLRQLYYQFVALDLFPDDRKWRWNGSRWIRNPSGTKNADPNYKWLGGVINDARMAGLLDWNYIVDRTRNLQTLPMWSDPAEVLAAVAEQYRTDKWAAQDMRIEVWIEKDALVGVLEQACKPLEVPYFSCRGYTSQSEIWGAAQRLGRYISNHQEVVILHLGDHDPSGIDMTRDIRERLSLFMAQDLGRANPKAARDDIQWYVDEMQDEFKVERIALNMDQILDLNPPPNPAKLSDARGAAYIERYGEHSWELDAIPPTVLGELIGDAVVNIRDNGVWEDCVEADQPDVDGLTKLSKVWEPTRDEWLPSVEVPEEDEDDE